jgi:hypothetical protein
MSNQHLTKMDNVYQSLVSERIEKYGKFSKNGASSNLTQYGSGFGSQASVYGSMVFRQSTTVKAQKTAHSQFRIQIQN